MKKTLKFVMFSLIFALLFVFFSCGDAPECEHSFNNHISDNNATCTEDGTKTAKCERCDVTYTVADVGSKLNHSFVTYISDENATCTEDGTKTAKCESCDVTDTKTNIGSILEHSYGDFIDGGDSHYKECTFCETQTEYEAHDCVGGKCVVCGSNCRVTSGNELTLVYTDNGASYTVSGYTGVGDTVIIPDTHNGKPVSAIAEGVFSGLKTIKCVTIPKNMTHVGKDAFLNCSGLQAVHISDIAKWCAISFSNRDSNPLYYSHSLYLENEEITELNIPSGVTSIGNYAFIGGWGFKKINIPDGVTTIGGNTFTSCRGITTLVIPDSVTHIHTSAFFDCNDLVSVTLGAGVEYVSDTTFIDCYKMVEVINRSSLVIEAGSVDYGKVGLYALEVHFGPSRLIYEGDYIFYQFENKNYLVAYTGRESSPTLPESFNGESYEIYEYAFYRHYYLTKIVIPEGVTSVGQKVFSQCRNLREVEIPTTLTAIGKEAFYVCNKLTSVRIRDISSFLKIKFTTADSNPLYHAGNLIVDGLKVTSITLPEEITEIKSYAFAGATGLRQVNIHTGLAKIAANAFSGCNSLYALCYDGTREEWGQIDGTNAALYDLSVICIGDGESSPKKASIAGAMLSDDFEKYIVEPMFKGLEELLIKHLGEFVSGKTSISVSGYGKLKSFNAYLTDKSALMKYGGFRASEVSRVTKAYLSYAEKIIGKTSDPRYKEISDYVSAMNTVFSEYTDYNPEVLLEMYPYYDDYFTEEERAEYKALYDAAIAKWYEAVPAMEKSGLGAFAIDKSLGEEEIARKYNMIWTAISICVPDMTERIAAECEARAEYTPYFGR